MSGCLGQMKQCVQHAAALTRQVHCAFELLRLEGLVHCCPGDVTHQRRRGACRDLRIKGVCREGPAQHTQMHTWYERLCDGMHAHSSVGCALMCVTSQLPVSAALVTPFSPALQQQQPGSYTCLTSGMLEPTGGYTGHLPACLPALPALPTCALLRLQGRHPLPLRCHACVKGGLQGRCVLPCCLVMPQQVLVALVQLPLPVACGCSGDRSVGRRVSD